MTEPAKKYATYEDVLASPPNCVAEVLLGTLYTSPRPAAFHARATSRLNHLLGDFDEEGGGWIVLYEPELHLGADILVPDLAAWRRTRMEELPDAAYFELAPDWCCEVLSPSTARIDRFSKLPIYAREGVRHVWLVDPRTQGLEVFALDGATYRLLTTCAGEEVVRAEPFESLALPLAKLWAR